MRGIVGAGRAVGALHQFDALGECGLGGGDQDGIEIVAGALAEAELLHLAGPGGDVGGYAGGLADLFRGEVVAVGVAGALAGDDADADAHGNALRGALDHGFIDADGAGLEVLEVEVGVIAALGQSFTQIALQVLPGDIETRCKNGVRELHAFRLPPSLRGPGNLVHHLRDEVLEGSPVRSSRGRGWP